MEKTIKDYDDLIEIGKGSFGVVYKAKRKSDSTNPEQTVALKIINIPKLHRRVIDVTKKEISYLKTLSKPNCNPFVICYYDSYYDEERQQFLIEMEYIEGKNMHQFIDEIRENNPDEVVYYYLLLIAKDVTQGLKYIHNNGIIHNDIKPENIMIDSSFTPRIIDFGLSCAITNIIKNYCKAEGITPWYVPPEYLENKNRFPASDMWALGVTLYKTATEEYPYKLSREKVKELFSKIQTENPNKLNTTNEQLNEIVNNLLVKDVQKRLTADDLLKKLEIIKRPSFLK